MTVGYGYERSPTKSLDLNLDFLLNRKNIAVSLLYEVANKQDQAALQRADGCELMRLMKKYRIVDTLKSELMALYDDILAVTITNEGFSPEWRGGMRWFLEDVKKFAETRLKI